MHATLTALVAVMGVFVLVMGALGSYLNAGTNTWSNWFSSFGLGTIIGGSWTVGESLNDVIAAWLVVFCGLLLFIAGQIAGAMLRTLPGGQNHGTSNN